VHSFPKSRLRARELNSHHISSQSKQHHSRGVVRHHVTSVVLIGRAAFALWAATILGGAIYYMQKRKQHEKRKAVKRWVFA
jgi:uncharacterized protein HemX